MNIIFCEIQTSAKQAQTSPDLECSRTVLERIQSVSRDLNSVQETLIRNPCVHGKIQVEVEEGTLMIFCEIRTSAKQAQTRPDLTEK